MLADAMRGRDPVEARKAKREVMQRAVRDDTLLVDDAFVANVNNGPCCSMVRRLDALVLLLRYWMM